MTWKKFIYLVLVLVIAGGSALLGATAGGLAVYQAARTGKLNAVLPVQKTVMVSLPASTSTSTSASASPSPAPTKEMIVDSTSIETTITQAVAKVGPAVVTVVGTVSGQNGFFGQSSDATVSGSGYFISNQGYLLTNNHVVDGATNIKIVLSDGSQEDVKVIGTDPYSDVAVLKTEGKVPAVASLGNSDVLKPGESVIAIGSPLGDFKNTVTVGVVSATGRSIDTGNGYTIDDLIQTDAAINQGNSGGPLVNLDGQVIAMNTLIVRNSGSGTVAEGLGFAIPVNNALAVAKQIMEKGYISRPYLGIRWQQVTPDIANMYNLPAQWGVYISRISSNSPASKAGLQEGDIITGIGGVALDDTHSYLNTLFLHKPGDQVMLDVVRSHNKLQLQVILGEASSSSN